MKSVNCRLAILGCAWALVSSSAMAETITLNFNATAIPSGAFIWFNSIMKLGSATDTTVFFTNSHLTFTANATNYNLTVPNATVTFTSAVTESASTTFNAGTNTWQTSISGPAGLLTDNTWLSGLGFQTPGTGFGNLDVTWTADFSALTPVSLHWQAAAAVYTSFSTDNNALGVKPTDDNNASIYANSDHAGTPENYKSYVVGGATGGGGSNYTGSYSPTVSVTAEQGVPAAAVPTPASLAGGIVLLGGFALSRGRRHRR